MSEQDNWSNRPIISITISYAVASWGVIQFIDWIVKRYLLNTLWTDAAVIMALVLIPSILFFSWIKSKKDVDGFKWEKWFYLGNLILAGIMIVSMFLLQGNPTITESIIIVDEKGNESQVEIMKEEYIRKVTYAPFFSTVSKDWLSLALPMMISMDIRQDKSITTSESSHNTYLYLKKMDLENEKKLPKKIKEKIAYKNFSDYVLSGDIEGDLENGLSYIIDLYSRKTGESLVLEGVSTDIFELTDSIGNWIVESIHTNDLRTPRIKGENIHPKEFYSSDLLALEYYFKSYWKFHDGEVSGIKELMDDAIERDDKFAMAYTTRSWAYFTQGNRMAALADMDKALQYSGSLTEFQVFDVKDYYYSYNNERESRRKLLEMWVKIHPEDSHPSQQLMEHFKGGRQVVKAIAVGEAAFKRGHKDYFIIELAILYAQEGNHQKVEEYIRTYKKQFPGDTDILYRLGRIYSNEFKYEKALELFREYQTLNPRHFNTALNISMTQLQLGKIEEVESNVLKAKKFVESYQDSISWYNSMEYYYVSVGQMSDVIKLMEERWALEEKNATEFMMLGRKLDSEVMKRYISIGRGDEILRLIEEMKGKLKGDRSNYIPYYVVEFYFAQEDYEGFSSVFNKNKSSFQSNMPKEMYKAMLGYEQKFQGNYTEAISILEPIVENSSDWTAKYHLYDAYYQSGQYQKGLDGFNILLERNPIDAKPLLRKSQCLHNLGKREEAKEILAKLEHIFSNADKKYDIYQKMLVFKEQLYLKG